LSLPDLLEWFSVWFIIQSVYYLSSRDQCIVKVHKVQECAGQEAKDPECDGLVLKTSICHPGKADTCHRKVEMIALYDKKKKAARESI